MNSLLLFERAGLPVPRTFFCTTSERGLLDAFVDRPGGFPVITKIPGSSRGIEVIRADSRSSLYSTLDYLLATNIAPYLCAYVNNSTHGD
ncbi:MAG: hypothetical protein EBU88_19950 [Acidobacteria bacterium]|nr:hypothetical protein [Acidobacteriota bacterium]